MGLGIRQTDSESCLPSASGMTLINVTSKSLFSYLQHGAGNTYLEGLFKNIKDKSLQNMPAHSRHSINSSLAPGRHLVNIC